MENAQFLLPVITVWSVSSTATRSDGESCVGLDAGVSAHVQEDADICVRGFVCVGTPRRVSACARDGDSVSVSPMSSGLLTPRGSRSQLAALA